MVYISTAFYYEAESLINYFCLKKNKNIVFADVFENSKITLIVSGVGGINSAINLARFFSLKNITNNDTFINIGLCGCNNKNILIGTAVVVNKIKSSYTQKTFYPDIIYKHNFEEASIETFANPVCNNESECMLSDMETAEIYITASKFFKLHKIIFIKIISDYNLPKRITKEFIGEITNNKKIYDFIKTFFYTEDEEDFNKKVIKYTQYFCDMLKLTESMKNELYKLLMYYFLCGNNTDKLENFKIEEIKSKKELKKCFENLKKIILL